MFDSVFASHSYSDAFLNRFLDLLRRPLSEQTERRLSAFVMESDNIHDVEPNDFGRHPEYPHLVLFYVGVHYGCYTLRCYALPGRSITISRLDWVSMVGLEQSSSDFGYASDEYLSLFD